MTNAFFFLNHGQQNQHRRAFTAARICWRNQSGDTLCPSVNGKNISLQDVECRRLNCLAQSVFCRQLKMNGLLDAFSSSLESKGVRATESDVVLCYSVS